MKKFIWMFVMLFSLQSFAHEYYFSFAEVAYNQTSQKFEITLTVSTQDLELAIKKEGRIIRNIATVVPKTDEFKIIEKYLLQHFKIEVSKLCQLKMKGHDVSLGGTSDFYFESEKIPIQDKITFSFDLLMLQNKKQQNKVTFYYNNKTYTKPFLYNHRIQSIKLS